MDALYRHTEEGESVTRAAFQLFRTYVLEDLVPGINILLNPCSKIRLVMHHDTLQVRTVMSIFDVWQ